MCKERDVGALNSKWNIFTKLFLLGFRVYVEENPTVCKSQRLWMTTKKQYLPDTAELIHINWKSRQIWRDTWEFLRGN